MNISPMLFALALGVSSAYPVAAQVQQPSSPRAKPAATLFFYYFREVVSQKYPNRPVQANITRDKLGHEQYTFFDRRNNETFHDGAWIEAHFA